MPRSHWLPKPRPNTVVHSCSPLFIAFLCSSLSYSRPLIGLSLENHTLKTFEIQIAHMYWPLDECHSITTNATSCGTRQGWRSTLELRAEQLIENRNQSKYVDIIATENHSLIMASVLFVIPLQTVFKTSGRCRGRDLASKRYRRSIGKASDKHVVSLVC